MVKLDASSVVFRVAFFLVTLIPFITFIVSAVYWKKLRNQYDKDAESSSTPNYGVARKQMTQMYGMMIFLSVLFALLTVVSVYLLVVPPKKVEEHKEKVKGVVESAKASVKEKTSKVSQPPQKM